MVQYVDESQLKIFVLLDKLDYFFTNFILKSGILGEKPK